MSGIDTLLFTKLRYSIRRTRRTRPTCVHSLHAHSSSPGRPHSLPLMAGDTRRFPPRCMRPSSSSSFDSVDTRRFHPRYTRPANGAILETVDAVRFRVELEDLAILSTYFEDAASARRRKPIQLGLVSSETLLFTLDLLTGSLGSGRAPRMPELTEDFLDELTSLTFFYQLCGPLAYVAREAAGPRPYLGRSPHAVIAYTLTSLYQRWVALNSPHLAAQLERESACCTPILGLLFEEKDFAGWPQRALQEYHPTALRAMRNALARRRELELRLDAIDALPLKKAGPCAICEVSDEGPNGTALDSDEEGGDGYVHVETEEERRLRRRQRVLGPRLAKLEKIRDAKLVAHLGYCCVRCSGCRAMVRDMVLRIWTYGLLDEWRKEWHFGTAFKFPPAQLDMSGHDCADPSRPCPDSIAYSQRPQSGQRNSRSPESADDDGDSSHSTEKRASVASGTSAETARPTATSRETGTHEHDTPDNHRSKDDHHDLYQAGLLPPAPSKARAVEQDTAESFKSGHSTQSLQAPSFASQATSQASSEGPFRYDDMSLLDTTDSESSYGHLPETDSIEELHEHYERLERYDHGVYDSSYDHSGGYDQGNYEHVNYGRYREDYDDGYDPFAHVNSAHSSHSNTPSPTGTVRVLGTPTNILGVINETEEEYESSRGSVASNRQLSPNPVGAWLERQESEMGDNDTPAIVITGTEGESAHV